MSSTVSTSPGADDAGLHQRARAHRHPGVHGHGHQVEQQADADHDHPGEVPVGRRDGDEHGERARRRQSVAGEPSSSADAA